MLSVIVWVLAGMAAITAAVLAVLVAGNRPSSKRAWRRSDSVTERPVEYMYVTFPDGTVRRCRATADPLWGFPTTPGLDSPEWQIVRREE